MMKDQLDQVYKSVTGYPDQTIETVPDLATAIVTTGGAAWTMSAAFGTLLLAASNTYRRKIVAIVPTAPSILENYIIGIYLDTVLVASVPVAVETLVGALSPIILPKPIFVEAGVLIQCKSATASGADTIGTKLICVPA
ncbi:hypothetical protein M0R72_05975 [Candidatus Pacearchaeota archaeon]|jgi:hypothetical protein|nr:hypothetical protein [Candidatus Pacearchaeota archaeon]